MNLAVSLDLAVLSCGCLNPRTFNSLLKECIQSKCSAETGILSRCAWTSDQANLCATGFDDDSQIFDLAALRTMQRLFDFDGS